MNWLSYFTLLASGCKILGLESEPDPRSQIKPRKNTYFQSWTNAHLIAYTPSIRLSSYFISHLVLLQCLSSMLAWEGESRLNRDVMVKLPNLPRFTMSSRGWLNVEDCFNELWPRFSIQQSWHLEDVAVTSSSQSSFEYPFHDQRSFPEISEIRMIIYIHEHFWIYSRQWINWRLFLKCQTNYILRLAFGCPNHFCMLDAR